MGKGEEGGEVYEDDCEYLALAHGCRVAAYVMSRGIHSNSVDWHLVQSSSDESFKQEYDEILRENNELKRKKDALEKALIDTKYVS